MYTTLKKLMCLFDSRTRLQFVFLFGLMFVTAMLEMVGIGLIMPFIAVMVDPGIIETNIWLRNAKRLIRVNDQFDFLIAMSIGMVAFYTIKNLSLGALNYMQLRFVFSKRTLLGKRLLRSYMQKPYTFHLERNTAELVRNIMVESIRVFNFVQSLLKTCSELFVLCIVSVMLLWINPIVVILSVGILGILSSIFYKSISGYVTKLGKKVQSSLLHVHQSVLEGIGAIKEVKLFGCEEYFPDHYYFNMMENARANWRYSTINMMPRLFLEVIAVGSVCLVIVVLQIQGKDVKILLPTLGLFAMAAIRLMPSLSQILANLHAIRFDSSAVDVIYADMGSSNKVAPCERYENSSQQLLFVRSLNVNNLGYIYPNSNVNVLRGISLEVIKGQAIAFAGPSGAGKTTLANLILGLLTPSEGSIRIDDQNIFEHLSAWQSMIGYVPQTIYLLDATIKRNIAFGLEENEIDDNKVRKAVEIAQLETFVNELPDGLNTVIGENGVRLSGGQRQRLGIARALYHEPEILILDEATSSLDGETEREVSQAIEILSGRKTLIIIAHRLSTIRKCNNIYYMGKGVIVDSGTFEQLMLKNTEFKRMAESSKIET